MSPTSHASLLTVFTYLFSSLIFSSQSSFSLSCALFYYFHQAPFLVPTFLTRERNIGEVHKLSKLPKTTTTIQVFSAFWSSNPVTCKGGHISAPCEKLSKYKTTACCTHIYSLVLLEDSWLQTTVNLFRAADRADLKENSARTGL